MERYYDMLPMAKGAKFAMAWRFEDDNEHVAAMKQTRVQDII